MPRKTLLNIALAAVGVSLLVLTVQRVGWVEVRTSVTSLGWWFLPVLALGGIRFAARARAWRECLRAIQAHSLDAESRIVSPASDGVAAASIGTWPLFQATLAADALGNLTPLGLLASEPAKVYLVNRNVPTIVAVASVAAENAFYVASVLVMIGAGALAFVELVNLSSPLRGAAQGILLVVMAGALTAVWVARRQPAILSWLARLIAAATGRGQAAPERMREIETRVYAIVRWPASRLARVLVWEALFHAAAVAEVFMVARLLPAGGQVTLLDAFVLETAGRLIVVAFKFIPYRLGVDEAGTALVARALAIDPAVGVTLALVRRIRILCWNAVGLGLLFTHRGGSRATRAS